MISQAEMDVLAERRRQVTEEKFDAKHDRNWRLGELADAAVCYAMTEDQRGTEVAPFTEARAEFWPWDEKWWKPKDRRRDLVRAAALLIAEIDRMDARG